METKKLYKSRADKKISGVCGGIAEYFNVDSTVVRLIAVVLLFAGAFVITTIGYFVAAAIIPDSPY